MFGVRSGPTSYGSIRCFASSAVGRGGIELLQALKQMRSLRIERVPDLPYREIVPLASESHRGPHEVDENKAPMVMVHGIWGHGRMFGNVGRRVVAATKRDFISCDLRNHGCSGLGAPHNYMSMANDTIAFVEKLGKPAVLGGYLMGAKVAMVAGLLRPDLFEKLVIVDNSPVVQPLDSLFMLILLGMASIERDESLKKMPQQERMKKIEKVIAEYVDNTFFRQYLTGSFNRRRTEEDKLTGTIYKAPVLNFLKDNTLAEVGGWPEQETLGLKYDKPVHVLRGLQSNFVSDENLKKDFAKYFSNVTTTDFDTGHFILGEKPEDFMKAFVKASE